MCEQRSRLAGLGAGPAARLHGLWPPRGARTVVVVIDGPLTRHDVAGLCAAARRLLTTRDVSEITYDVGAAVAPDLTAIDAVARLELTARRAAGSIRVRRASGELRALLAAVGLCDVVALCDGSPLEPGGHVEEGEQTRVEEGVQRSDPAG
jgi:STAS domain